MIDFDHINLADVDDSRKPVAQNVYTFQVNSLNPVTRTVKKEGSPYQGQSILVLDGHFEIVEDSTYSGRRFKQGFWTPFKGAQISLKRLMKATGNPQGEQSITDWANSYAQLNPPARFQALLTLAVPRGQENDPTAEPENSIDLFTAKPV